MTWPNWTPPDDIQIDGNRPLPPREPAPDIGPDTDLLLIVDGNLPGEAPAPLIVPWRLVSANTPIPAKGVVGIGPQPGTSDVIYPNLGNQILVGWQPYLEMAGQRQVGLLPRSAPVEHNQLWDADFILNPTVEVV
jgi:hypothetical protein